MPKETLDVIVSELAHEEAWLQETLTRLGWNPNRVRLERLPLARGQEQKNCP